MAAAAAATKKVIESEEPERFFPPLAEIGQVVYWYDGGTKSDTPCTAIVTRVHQDSLCLHVISAEMKNFIIREGVRHCSDPRAKQLTPDVVEAGVWDHTPMSRRSGY